MKKLKFSGKHILLLLLYSPGQFDKINEPIRGRTRIIKMMFLFDKEIKENFIKNTKTEIISFPKFIPWKYGPFAKDVYDDIEFFINNSYIDNTPLDTEMTESELNEFGDWVEDFLFDDEIDLLLNVPNEECFKITTEGLKLIAKKKYYDNLSENQKRILKRFKAEINISTLEAILRYTYSKYPNYTLKSNIKEHILG